MNNKLRQGLIISTIVILGLLGQVKEAIAQTLNDKNIDKTEELARITDNTASAINMNFDLDRSSPDVSAVKQFFMTPGFLSEIGLRDFNTIWDKAAKSLIWPYREEAILDIFSRERNDFEKVVLILAILDPTGETDLGERVIKEISNNKLYQYKMKQIISIMEKKQSILEIDERIQKTDERIQKTDERIQKTDERI
ncbi:MAG TPA: hypothetical protein PK674_02010, partial [Candidatus Absconditabacterales bacterium]|nr:hypothetical protein [Candidatus Absconditabacterales bacterium]HOQ79143.1 hypothetical protein [Candidatus Absconditabacterales bacterium]HPK28065.1 hypothetical protein [Candidatus Absconditabacterales bacterium]